MDRSDLGAKIVAHIDQHHPRFGSRLMKLRWGGLRTVQPDRHTWAGLGALGVGMGVASRTALGRRRDGRHRLPVPFSVAAGVMSVWVGAWRIDSVRWRRSHVTLVLDLPNEVLEDLLDRLSGAGLQIERHDGPRGVGGSSSGLTCRLRDLRRVNAELDALDAGAGQRLGSAEA